MPDPRHRRRGRPAVTVALGRLFGRFLAFGLAVVLVLAASPEAPRASEMPAAAVVPAYLGSAACTGCHQDATAAWTGSDHQLAWTLPDPDTVLGDFEDAEFTHGGVTTRFRHRDGTYYIEAEGADGVRREYPVIGVAGIRPLQQYLLSPAPGRLQAYDIAWDVVASRWYPVFPDQTAPPGDGFHWTGPYKSWEARCAECHATGYSRNYDIQTRSYAPEMVEIGVGCEACHGPGAEHVAWATAPANWTPKAGLTPLGLTVDLAADPEVLIGQCSTCHSRREALIDGNPVPGTPYHDAYVLSLLREGLYFPDGAMQDEVYNTGSFLQAKMHAKGVQCTDCHEPHSLQLRAEGNAVCTQCHSPAGNPRFPSLTPAAYDSPAHTFHPEGSPGAACPACHMPERTYMGIDARHDHAFQVPRPDLAAATGAPDACTACHSDRDPAWAAAAIAGWYPEGRQTRPHFAPVFAAARRDPGPNVPELLAIAEDPATSGIVRATALELAGFAADPAAVDRSAALLSDPDPLVRAAAAGSLGALPPADRLARLTPALTDPVRSVRVAAARALLDAQPMPGTASGAALTAAMRDWQAALSTRMDFPETNLQIAGVGLTMRNWSLALDGFREAVALDPQLVDGWSMIVQILAALNRPPEAQAALAEALAANPGDPALTQLAAQLGLR